MSLKQRKLVFYSLQVASPGDLESALQPQPLKDFIKELQALPREDRIRLISEKNKMQMLSDVYEHSTFLGVVFKSSKYRHRPPLMHIKGGERENPKTLEEGDAERTHVAMRFLAREVIMVLEERRAGLSAKMITEYLQSLVHKRYSPNIPFFLRHSLIPKGTFLDELNKMIRVKVGMVTVEKTLLGDEGIEFSNRTEEVKDDVYFRIQARKGMSIAGTISDIFEKMESAVGVEKKVHRIRVEGTGENGREAILDTNFVKRVEFVDVEIDDETGVVNTSDFFLKVNPIISAFSDS